MKCFRWVAAPVFVVLVLMGTGCRKDTGTAEKNDRLEGKIEQLKTELAELNENYSHIAGKVDDQANQINQLESALDSLKKTPAPEANRIEIKDLYVNVAETQATRILKLSAVLKLSNEDLGPAVQERIPQIRDVILEEASKMTIENLSSTGGIRKFKQTIMARLNVLLRDLSDEAVQDIFFPDFLIQ